jgi:hypothetical protein
MSSTRHPSFKLPMLIPGNCVARKKWLDTLEQPFLLGYVCGFGVYVAMEATYQTAEYQKTVQNTTVNGKINTTKGIIGLTNDKNLPSLDSV